VPELSVRSNTQLLPTEQQVDAVCRLATITAGRNALSPAVRKTRSKSRKGRAGGVFRPIGTPASRAWH